MRTGWLLGCAAMLAGACNQQAVREADQLRAENAQLHQRLSACRDEVARAAPALPADAGAAAQVRLAVAAPVAAPAHAAPDAAAEPPPLVPISSHLVPNIIGQPELLFTVRQSGTRTIDGMQFRAELFNNFNDPVMHRIRGEDNVYVGESDERLAPRPRAPVRVMARWTLHSFDTATKAIVTITRVHFTDGSSWEGAARQEVDPRIPERAAPGR